jgi:hypothetical protein
VSCAARSEELDRALDGRVDRLGRHAVTALHELAELVDDGAVARATRARGECLRGEDLPDRRRERRPARLGADAPDLLEHLEQPIGRRRVPQVDVERATRPAGGRTRRRARRSAAHVGARLVADALVDRRRRPPRACDVDPCVAQALERLGDGLARDAVQRERERVDRGRDQVGAGVDGCERGGEADSGRALDVEAHGEPARLSDARDELLRAVRDERTGRVVDEDPGRTESGSLRACSTSVSVSLSPVRPGL